MKTLSEILKESFMTTLRPEVDQIPAAMEFAKFLSNKLGKKVVLVVNGFEIDPDYARKEDDSIYQEFMKNVRKVQVFKQHHPLCVLATTSLDNIDMILSSFKCLVDAESYYVVYITNDGKKITSAL